MRKIGRIVSVFALTALLLTGCSSGGKSSSTTTSSAAASTSSEAAAVTSPLTGILQSYSGEILSVKAVDGNVYLFHIADRSVFVTTDALNVGDTVEVTFSGEVKGTDTTHATVSKVEDKTSTEQTVKTIVGTVTDATMNTLTIQTDSAVLTFNVGDANMVTTNGIVIGNTVYIDYVGTINGTDTSNVVVQTVVDNDDNKQPVQTVVPTATPIVTATPTPEPTLVPADEIPVTATNEWMYATRDNNIYRGNSTAYKKIAYLYSGQGITVTGRTSNGWYRVDQDGVTGFVPFDALTTNSPATPTPTAAPTETPVVKHHLYINYMGTDGTKVATAYDGLYKPGEAYSVNSPTLLGGTPDQSVVYGTMGDSDIFVTVTYTPFYYNGIGSGASSNEIGNGAHSN